MAEYFALYDVSYSSRRGDEYNRSWVGEYDSVLKKFEAGDDSKAREMACGEIFDSLSGESSSRKNVRVELKLVLEGRIVEDNLKSFEDIEYVSETSDVA